MIVFYFLLMASSLLSCGYYSNNHPPTRVIVNRNPSVEGTYGSEGYTFNDIKKTCTSCHNSSAPFIPLDESGFKSNSKIKEEILKGDMPPGGGLDIAKAKKYFEG